MSLQLSREQIEAPLHRFEHFAMNGDWEIFIAAPDGELARQAAFTAFEEVDRIEADISRFWSGSDVCRLNAAALGEVIRIGPYARDCLLLSGEISEATQGAFDPMVARAMDTIRAGGHSHRGLLPDAPLIEIDPLNGAVTVLGEGVALDFGALGKGYALDCIIEILREWGFDCALAHAAYSSVYALGAPPGLEGWPLALADPRTADGTLATLLLRDQAMGGSGFRTQGRHILDPRSGAQVYGKMASWAASASAARADAFSTALVVMEPEEMQQFFAAHPAESGLVLWGDAADPQVLRSGIFAGVELDFSGYEAPPTAENTGNFATPCEAFVGRRVTLVFREPMRRAGLLVAADAQWLHLQSEEGAALLVPRDALLWVEAQE